MTRETVLEDQPISEKSVQLLKQCRNWRSAKFAMIRHGTDVVRLAVDKKSIAKAKKEIRATVGSGQMYFGTIRGDEDGFSFELARSDGFDSVPPVPIAKLKKFLSEQGVRYPVRYEIVDSPEDGSRDEE